MHLVPFLYMDFRTNGFHVSYSFLYIIVAQMDSFIEEWFVKFML